MRALLNNGSWVDIDTKHLFNNQYNTTDGKRIFDKDIQRIEDDPRGDLGRCRYCGKIVRRGEEEQHFTERENNTCTGCHYYTDKLIEKNVIAEHTETVTNADGSTTETTIKTVNKVYEKECTYNKYSYSHDCKCVNKGCRHYGVEWFTPENTFFLAYPNGLPAVRISIDELRRRGFLAYDYADKYSCGNRFVQYKKKLGSYTLEAGISHDENGHITNINWFVISNTRKRFTFIVDDANSEKVLIDDHGFGWRVRDPEEMKLPRGMWEDVKKLCAPEF